MREVQCQRFVAAHLYEYAKDGYKLAERVAAVAPVWRCLLFLCRVLPSCGGGSRCGAELGGAGGCCGGVSQVAKTCALVSGAYALTLEGSMVRIEIVRVVICC